MMKNMKIMNKGLLLRTGDGLRFVDGKNNLLPLHEDSTDGWTILERTWYFREMENLEVEGEIVDGKFKPNKPNMDWSYWKNRCLAAEKFIEESPCGPDIRPDQIDVYNEWRKWVRNER
jgi:hypothetical protein